MLKRHGLLLCGRKGRGEGRRKRCGEEEEVGREEGVGGGAGGGAKKGWEVLDKETSKKNILCQP